MILDKDIIARYKESRLNTHHEIICHAPFVNLNFEQNGNARACCYNIAHILGRWPQQSIKEIWEGESANLLRGYVRENNLGGGCTECGRIIIAGNYQGVHSKIYDEYAPNTLGTQLKYLGHSLLGKVGYPKVMEFELSNQCNLECIMCSGYFSSSIRKNREHLPPTVSPYNKEFVNQLEEFIPHLTDAKFLGGEPFMIDIYLDIWERIRALNPRIRIHITSNGTFLNSRIKDLLEGLQAGIILSIDSVNPETYQKIRVNSNFDKVMENLEYFQSYTSRKKTFLSIAACPMPGNWKEMPQLLEFCIQRNISLHFNAVFSPVEHSLREQSAAYLQEIISFLESNPAPALEGSNSSPRNLSIKAYSDYANMLRGWYKERRIKEDQKNPKNIAYSGSLNSQVASYLRSDVKVTWSLEEIKSSIATYSQLEAYGYEDKDKNFRSRMANLFAATPPGGVQQVLVAYLEWYNEKNNGDVAVAVVDAVQEKISFLSYAIEQHPKRSEMLAQISQSSPGKFAEGLLHSELEYIQSAMQKLFG